MHRIVPRILFIVFGTVFAVSLAYLLAHRRSASGNGQMMIAGQDNPRSADPLIPDPSTSELSVPPFTLTTSDGGTINRDALLGHITIVDFFFTRCTFVCPVLTQQMVDQSKALRGTGVRLLSISVDPVHETDESLATYAAEHVPRDVENGKWVFARGDKETIGAIITGGLKFAVGEDPDRTIPIEGGRTMQNIVHPPWFVLTGPKAEVLGIYKATDEGEMRALTARAKAAAAQMTR
jgi:protein SCO1/2